MTTRLIMQIYTTLKTKLRCPDRLDRVRSMMKTRQDMDMTDHTSSFYAENETELS